MSEYQPSRKASRVGQTKTVGGKSYRLNENHRWELIDTDTSKNLDVTPRATGGHTPMSAKPSAEPSKPEMNPQEKANFQSHLETLAGHVRAGRDDHARRLTEALTPTANNYGIDLKGFAESHRPVKSSAKGPEELAESKKQADQLAEYHQKMNASPAAPKAEAKPNSELLEKSKKAAQHSKTLLGHMGASAEKIHANLIEQSKGSGKLTPEAHMMYAKAHDALADSHFNEAQKLEGDAWMFTAAGSKDYSAEHEQAGLNHRAVADAHRKATNGYYD